MYADSMAFLNARGEPPILEQDSQLSIAHLTSVPPREPYTTDFRTMLEQHKAFRDAALQNPNTHMIKTVEDLQMPGTGLLFGLQSPLAKRLTFDRLFDLAYAGVRVMTLAYEDATVYGGGYLTCEGLTRRGEEMLQLMEDIDGGMILDLSHLNIRTSRDVLQFIRRKGLSLPVMASHSGCHELFAHPRNVPDDILRDLEVSGGYIGIPAVLNFLAKIRRHTDYFDAFVRHIKHVLRRFGPFVGIGSACIHRNLHNIGNESGIRRFPEFIRHGDEMFSLLERNLLAGGLRSEDVGGVCGENFRDFLLRSLPSAPRE